MSSSDISTNSAYILFYKRAENVIDHEWWKNYVDKRLFCSSDFVKYIETYRTDDNAHGASVPWPKPVINPTDLPRSQSNYDLRELSSYSSDGCDETQSENRSAVPINYYDETRKPMRLLNKAKQPATINIASHPSSHKSNIVNSGVFMANVQQQARQQKLMIDDMDFEQPAYNRQFSRDYNQILQPERVNQPTTTPDKSLKAHSYNPPIPKHKNFDELTNMFKQKFQITDEQFNPKTQEKRYEFNAPSLNRRQY
jgi:hypothetical protein